jgi:ABC-type transport system involved in multi-copper enzyme maturation permease subunit
MRWSPVAAIAAYTLLEARRHRLLWLALGLIGAGFVLTEFIGEVAITESRELQSAFFGALLRVLAVLVVSLFVITSMVRELNDKVFELVLALPVPRALYFLGKLVGYCAVAGLAGLLCGAFVLIYAPAIETAVWAASLVCELLIVTALSLLCLFTFSQVTAALCAVLAFYALARTIAAIQLIAQSPLVASPSTAQPVIDGFLAGLAFLLPELHRFTDSAWLAYGDVGPAALLPVLGQTLVYLVLLSGAALFDLYRKAL